MSTRDRRIGALCGVTALVTLLAFAVFTPVGGAERGTTTAAKGKVWTTAEVNAALPKAHIKLVWNVPKSLPKRYVLGFVNWSETYPFFTEWSKGMIAAARLFHVGFYEADAKWDTTQFVNLYNELETHHLDAVGFGATSSVALVQAATHDGVKAVSIDASTPGAYGIGVDSAVAGRLAGSFLGPALKAKLAGPWKGSNVLYVGFSGAGCGTCDLRIKSEETTIRKYAKISATSITDPANNTDIQRTMADLITSHPGWKFVIASEDDENPAAAIPALQSAGQMSNALIVTLGGDLTGRNLVRKYPQTVIGAVDFNPFAEGFNWVVASLAVLNHKHFAQYPVTTVLTPANVNKYYPNDATS